VDGRASRLRAIARDGFLLLAAPGADLDPARSAACAVRAPTRVLELAAIDTTGALADALAVRAGEVWVLRPDAHIAAVLEHPAATELEAVLHRATAGSRVPAKPHSGHLPP
jgi:pentachlorophenol monooxygenase/3-(3-hydroxy-phenyl)propionate hydroxylase